MNRFPTFLIRSFAVVVMIVAVAMVMSIFDFCENPRDAERVDNAVRVVICKCAMAAINETDSDDVDAERRKFAAYIEQDGVCKDVLSGSLFLVVQDSKVLDSAKPKQ